MKSWASLPTEICEQVFEHLATKGKRDLKECRLTSRAWNESAQKYFYRHINYGNLPMDKRSHLKEIITQCPDFGKYTRSIDFGIPWENSFIGFPALFPNAEYLTGNIMFAEFWPLLLAEHHRGSWTSLKQIPNFKPEQIQAYLPVALLHASTLEVVQVQFYPEDDDLSRITPLLTERLNEFVHMKKLKIEYHHGRVVMFGNQDDQMNDVLERVADIIKFDRLVDICCNSLNSISMNVYADFFKHYTVLPNILFSGSDLREVIQRPLIKHFCGKQFLYSKKCIDYFMHKFPNLDSFNDIQVLSALNVLDTDLLNFFGFVSKIRNFSIGGELTDDYYLKKVFSCFLKAGDYNNILVSLKYCSELIWSADIVKDILFFYSTLDSFTFSEWADRSSQLFVDIRFKDQIAVGIRHEDILIKHGPKIKQLRFDTEYGCGPFYIGRYMDDSELDYDEITDKAVSKSLNHILEYCINLETLALYDIFLPAFNNQHDMKINRSITKLDLIIAAVGGNTVLPELSTRLPSLKFLSIQDCLFCDELRFEGSNAMCIDMPSTSFDTITWITNSPDIEAIAFNICI